MVRPNFCQQPRRRPVLRGLRAPAQAGTFGSLVELQAAIKRFLAETNADPRSFVRTARPEHILEKVRRGNQALGAIHQEQLAAKM